MNSSSGEWAGVLIVVAIIFWFSGAFSPKNETTDYFRFCNQIVASAQDCTSWSTGSTKYYVNDATQQVQFVDISPVSGQPYSFSDCTVADVQNWYCNTTGAGGGFGYKNGVVVDDRPFVDTGITAHFGMYKYWWYSALSWIAAHSNEPVSKQNS